MSRGGSAGRPPAERSAAAAKGWASRKRLAAARAERPEGSESDRAVAGAEIGATIARIRASLAARGRA